MQALLSLHTKVVKDESERTFALH